MEFLSPLCLIQTSNEAVVRFLYDGAKELDDISVREDTQNLSL